MKQQLEQLLETLEQQQKVKRDYVAGRENLHFVDGKLFITRNGVEVQYTPTAHFHSQMSAKLDIPKGYYDRMLNSKVKLLDQNVNEWLHAEQKAMLVRTFEEQQDNVARAFLSDSYNIMDNYDVLFETLDAIRATGIHVEIKNAELSETRMYLKIACPEIEVQATEMLKMYRRSIEAGSGVIAGFVLKNSEIGAGAFSIMPRAIILACQNGAVVPKDELKRIHLGSKMDEFFAGNERVRKANVTLIKEQVKHAVNTFLSKDYLNKIVRDLTEAGEKKIEAPVSNVVEVIGKEYGFSEDRKHSILNYFIQGADTRRIGMFNAITEECQMQEDADVKHDSELIAAQVLNDFDRLEAKAMKQQRSAS